MKRGLTSVLSVLLCLSAASLHPQDQPVYAHPRYRARPDIISLSEDPLPRDPNSYLRAGITVSGGSEADASRYAAMAEVLMGEMIFGMPEGAYERAEYVLSFLHERLFRSYVERETTVGAVFESGRYNCVSSSVLYGIFAAAAGLHVVGVATADHAFCSVVTEKGPVDVETTNVYGFDPGNKKEFRDTFGNITGFSYVPPTNYLNRSELGENELLGLILQNLISEFQRKRMFDAAVGLAADRHALVNSGETRDDMLNAFINYAAQLNERGSYDEAISFLIAAGSEHGAGTAFDGLLEILVSNQTTVRTRAGDYEGALRSLDTYGRMGAVSTVKSIDISAGIRRQLLVRRIRTASFEDARASVWEAAASGLVDERTVSDYLVSIYGREAERLTRGKQYLEALSVIEEGLEATGGNAGLSRALDTMVHNYAVSVHNRFAELYNAGMRESAERALLQALERIPGNRILLQDLAVLRRSDD